MCFGRIYIHEKFSSVSLPSLPLSCCCKKLSSCLYVEEEGKRVESVGSFLLSNETCGCCRYSKKNASLTCPKCRSWWKWTRATTLELCASLVHTPLLQYDPFPFPFLARNAWRSDLLLGHGACLLGPLPWCAR